MRTSPSAFCGPGSWRNLSLAGVDLPPIDSGWVDLGPVVRAGQHADALVLQILGLLHEARDEIERRHALRHAPVREEVERLDGGAHGRRLPLGLADDDTMALLDLVLVDRLELEGAGVDDDIALLRPLPYQIAQALQVDLELGEARMCGNVQRLQRGAVGPTRDPQPVVLLEAADGAFQVLRVGDAEQRLRRLSPQVAAEPQSSVQQGNSLVIVFRANGSRARNRRPAAVRHDLLVALDRPLQGLDHFLAAQRHSARAQIAERVLAALLVVDRRPWTLLLLEAGEGLPPLLRADRRRRRNQKGRDANADPERGPRPCSRSRVSPPASHVNLHSQRSLPNAISAAPPKSGRGGPNPAQAVPGAQCHLARSNNLRCTDMAKQRPFTKR